MKHAWEDAAARRAHPTLEIVSYPHPALRAENAEISAEGLDVVGPLSRRMFDLMYEADGVGLAAPQVGVNKRLMVFNPAGSRESRDEEVVWINPTIVETSAEAVVADEGCLSFPDMVGAVSRHQWVDVRGVDVAGETVEARYEGWTARIFQHEYDHLCGVCYVDRLDDDDRARVVPELEDLEGDFEGGVKWTGLLERDALPREQPYLGFPPPVLHADDEELELAPSVRCP